jgi:S1-C subfamily serine protease
LGVETELRGTVTATCLLLLAATIAGCAGGPVAPVSPGQSYAASTSPHPSGVTGRTLFGLATGFFIARDKVLTNFHVVRSCMALTVGNNREGKEIEARYDYGDPQSDLAILTTEPTDVTPAHFETAIGADAVQDLSVVGYPAVGLPTFVAELDKVVADPKDVANEQWLYPFSGTVQAGNSGSPVLNNRGAVVGVVSARVNTARTFEATGMVVIDVGLAIPNQAVFDFLDKNEIPYLRADATKTLVASQVLAEAHGFVRQVGCWK